MTIKEYILENMPESWLICATEMHMKTELVQRLIDVAITSHLTVVSEIFKVRKRVIDNIFAYFNNTKCEIMYLVDSTNMDREKWSKLSNRIIEYEHLC